MVIARKKDIKPEEFPQLVRAVVNEIMTGKKTKDTDLDQLAEEYEHAKRDPGFQRDDLFRTGRLAESALHAGVFDEA